MNTFTHKCHRISTGLLSRLMLGLLAALSSNHSVADIAQSPLFLTDRIPPIVMLVLDRHHRLYYEAYNDASDLDGDGLVDVGYKPSIDYYGYFDSHRCYSYNSNSGGYFEPQGTTTSDTVKTCPGSDWSGDFLNYLTTSRMDALRKVLYGGFRSTDTTTDTVLKRAFIPQDAHSWGKEYNPANNPGYLISDYTPLNEPAVGKKHLFANTSLAYGAQPLLRVFTDTNYRVWEWLSIERPVAGNDCDNGSRQVCTNAGGTRTDYSVNVKVCVTGKLEANCKAYNNNATTTYKPTGLLHDYGENDAIAFGLLSGTYKKNISGGVLRKNISSFKDELDLTTGIFSSSVKGIVYTINSLSINTFNYGCPYCYASGWITTRPINEGEAAEWGNPIAEIMYEGLRYFAGKASPSSAFSIASSDTPDGTGALNLPLPNWRDPYQPVASGGGGYLSCSKPVSMVISDVNVSYDSDQLPNSYFGTFSSDLAGLDVSTLADTIWAGESEDNKIFVGQSGTVYDGAPTPKSVSSFKNIRGIAPEEPTKLGSFYAGSVALFGALTDLNPVINDDGVTNEKDEQKTNTISVALASPLPRIEIPVAGKKVTLVPFAKSVAGASISATKGNFQPTNQIVDFYIDKIVNTATGNMDNSINGGRPYGKFRINYEDVEQAADHDMDAIVEYTFTVNSSNQVVIDLNSIYAAGGITQHMGYVISGTTADGIYLEVLDQRTNDVANDTDYYLDTPPGKLPGNNTWNDSQPLPFTTSRTFTVGSTSASYIKHDPLWYAAKWGVTDQDDNGIINAKDWDSDNNQVPDNYFLVTNAGKLPEQLGKAFSKALSTVSSASAVAANSTRLDTGAQVYQAKFNSGDWNGQLIAFHIDPVTGTLSEDWNVSSKLPSAASRNIYTYDPSAGAGSRGIPFLWSNLTASQKNYLSPANTDDGKLDWLRGDTSNEEVNGGTFRNRHAFEGDTSNAIDRIGDIINSDPVFVGKVDYGYKRLPGAEGSSYLAFRQFIANRKPMLYVGANDGMLHGFDSRATNGGKEIFAYVPNALFPNLAKLTSPSYVHQYFVDGQSDANDVYFNSEWHTLLAGTTGAGGRVVYALDVTNPDSFGSNGPLWEFTNADDADLGYTLAQPSVVRLQDGHWAVIVANGYYSDNGHAVLFILDAATGAVLQKIDTGAGNTANKNGLSSPIAVDTNNDLSVDTIYAGDLYGNLWKFNVSGSAGSWNIVGNSPFFVACTTNGGTSCSSANRQPITSKPNIGPVGGAGTPQNGVGIMIYFGTGKYFENTDNILGASPQVQTFYGLWDHSAAVTDRSMLAEQTITDEGKFGTASSLRIVSKNPVCFTSTSVGCSATSTIVRGWALTLNSPVNPNRGERAVSFPLFRRGLVIFPTIIPDTNPCNSGGSSWLMEVDALTGGEYSTPPFDANGNGTIDDGDKVTVNGADHATSGVDLNIGIIKTPAVVEGTPVTGKKTIDRKYASGSTGQMNRTGLAEIGSNECSNPPCQQSFGSPGTRGSWQELR